MIFNIMMMIFIIMMISLCTIMAAVVAFYYHPTLVCMCCAHVHTTCACMHVSNANMGLHSIAIRLLSQLQEKLDDLQTRLQRERDSWKLQETLYNERLKVFQDIQEVHNNHVPRNVLFDSLRNLVRVKSDRCSVYCFPTVTVLFNLF